MQVVQSERVTTDVAARILHVRPNTLRVALCKHGHYLGLRPVKLPNGRLLWPADAALRLAQGGTV